MQDRASGPSPWDEGRQYLESPVAENWAALQRTLCSSEWLRIARFLQQRYGGVKGLETVELGCGRGVTLAALATKGAEVPLVDRSEPALSKAREFFANNRLNPRALVYGDLAQVFARTLDPAHRPDDRQRQDETVDLNAFGEQTVDLIFEMVTSRAGKIPYDWGGWSTPVMVGEADSVTGSSTP
jgi:SAM-dependent methyltransferase